MWSSAVDSARRSSCSPPPPGAGGAPGVGSPSPGAGTAAVGLPCSSTSSSLAVPLPWVSVVAGRLFGGAVGAAGSDPHILLLSWPMSRGEESVPAADAVRVPLVAS
jgi:hypothetical protein